MRALALLLLTGVALARPPVFADLTVAQAREKARQEHKRLLIDATAVWCGPCHHMEETTWVDPSVVEACRDLVVVQLDVDQDKPLAQELGIKAMPTMILFDGEREVDRIQGSRDAAALIAWLKLTGTGGRESDRLAAAARAGDMQAHQDWADALFLEKRYDEAQREYLWLWEHLPAPVRNSFFAMNLRRLVVAVPAAAAPYRERLTVAAPGSPEWLALSMVVDDGQSVADYAVRVTGTPAAAALQPEERRVVYQLTKRGMWKEAGLFLTDPVASAREVHAQGQRLVKEDPGMADVLRRTTEKTLKDYARACREAGKAAEAAQIEALH